MIRPARSSLWVAQSESAGEDCGEQKNQKYDVPVEYLKQYGVGTLNFLYSSELQKGQTFKSVP